MGMIDFIFNLACLLLWLNWRSARFDPLANAGRPRSSARSGARSPAELGGGGCWRPLRRADVAARGHLLADRFGVEPSGRQRWILGLVAASFRSDSFRPDVPVLPVQLLGLMLVRVLSGSAVPFDPVRSGAHSTPWCGCNLGWWIGWPRWLNCFCHWLPVAGFGDVLSWPCSPWLHLSRARDVGRATLGSSRCSSAWAVIWSGNLSSRALLALHLVNSYIYFGKPPGLEFRQRDFTDASCGRCKRFRCKPAGWISRPVAGIALVFVMAEVCRSRVGGFRYERLCRSSTPGFMPRFG